MGEGPMKTKTAESAATQAGGGATWKPQPAKTSKEAAVNRHGKTHAEG